jgi:hypothetical protein
MSRYRLALAGNSDTLYSGGTYDAHGQYAVRCLVHSECGPL